jgi:signal transduction histidine kinase
MLHYGWFFSAGILLTGLALLLLRDQRGQRVLYVCAALFAFQALMETLRHLRPRFYDSVGVSRFRAQAYICTAAALVLLVGGIDSPFWLLFVLPIALTAVYGDRSIFFKYFVLAQILLVDLVAVYQTGWQAAAVVQGLVYAAVLVALLESATWLYVLAHFRQEERLLHLQLLNDAAQRLIPRRTLGDLAHEALSTALTLANARQGFLLVTQHDTGRLLAHAIRGLSLSQGTTIQELSDRCRSVTGRNSQSGRAVHFQHSAQFLYSRYFHDKIESALVVPVPTARGSVMATLHINSPKASYFPTPVPPLLEVYANQLATALDNAFFWEEQDRTLRHYRSLIEFGQKLLEHLDPQPILQRVVRYVRDALPHVDWAAIFWAGSRPGLYTQVAHAGHDPGLPSPAAVPLHQLFSDSSELPADQIVFSVPEAGATRWASVGVTPAPFRSLLVAQLRVGARLMGLLALGAGEPRAFSPVDEVFLGNLAGHVALAYRNAELHKQQQANRGRLARILQERAAWRLDQSLDALLRKMVRSAVRSLGFGAAVLYLLDPDQGGYVAKAITNLPASVEARLRRQLVTRDQVAGTLRPEFQVGDSGVYFIPGEAPVGEIDWARYRQALGPAHPSPSEWRTDDVLLVPLRRRDGMLGGLLALDAPMGKSRPTDDDGHVFENLADQVISTIEQWRQNDQLRQLSEVLASAIEETEATALYQFIVDAGARLLEAEDCSLFLNNTRNGTVEFEASSRLPRELLERKEVPISADEGAGLTAFVAATGTPLSFVGEEYKSHPAWTRQVEHLDYLPSRGCRSLALVALRNPGGRITGVLKVENKQGIDANLGFTEFDREILLPTLANAAAIAIERAHFYWRTSDLLVQKERDRLAGELHDLANVFHMGIMLRIEKLWEQLDGGPQHEPAQALRRLWHASRYVFGELIKMQEETRHPILIREGLIEALSNHSETISLSGVEFRNQVPGQLPLDVEHALYRLAQEALSNAKKHFQGITGREMRVTVSLRQEDQEIVLEISDNGPGFDVDRELGKPESFGLTRMMEIAEGIRARCVITSLAGQGTTVRVTVPGQEKKEEMLPVRQRHIVPGR